MQYYTTKEHLIESLKSTLTEIQKAMITGTKPAFYYAAKQQLVKDMLTKLEHSGLLELDEASGWYYNHRLDVYGIRIELCHKHGDENPSIYYPRITFLEIKAKLFSADIYAERYGVGATTIRQWIRRGKLPAVRKFGGEWRLTELMLPAGRGYMYRLYGWNRNETVFEGVLEFLQKYDGVSIEQMAADEFYIGLYEAQKDCDLSRGYPEYMDSSFDSKTMTAKEKEVFELKLLEHPDVKFIAGGNDFLAPTI